MILERSGVEVEEFVEKEVKIGRMKRRKRVKGRVKNIVNCLLNT